MALRISTLVAAMAIAGCGAAHAQATVRSTDLTCAQAAQLVQKKGAVVMATSPTLYDRYVRDQSFCLYDQQLRPEWVPTRDVKQCYVGSTCFEPFRGGGRN
jgi:curli biogenesis system outer membrane secretion channel CsgG